MMFSTFFLQLVLMPNYGPYCHRQVRLEGTSSLSWLSISRSTGVEYSLHYPKVEGSSPATIAVTVREKMVMKKMKNKILILDSWMWNY
jgi:hypothetical protein